MLDDGDNIYGKLHLVSNTSQLAGGPAKQVVSSTNQGRLDSYVSPATVWEQHNYVITHHPDQTYWLDDQNAEEA